MAGVLSAPAVAPSVSAVQRAYATISHLWFLTTEPFHQRRLEPAPETLGPGQNNGTGRTTGPVSPRRAIVGEIVIGSLGSGSHTVCRLLTPAHQAPKACGSLQMWSPGSQRNMAVTNGSDCGSGVCFVV